MIEIKGNFQFDREHPFRRFKGLFGGGDSKKLPPVAPTPVLPVVATETEDTAMKQSRRRSGFAKTLLTGQLSPTSDKKSVLG